MTRVQTCALPICRYHMANQYHLWVLLDGRCPFGLSNSVRLVSEAADGYSRQRPFEEKPDDLRDITSENVKQVAEELKDQRGEDDT